jgi:hypothetical protein
LTTAGTLKDYVFSNPATTITDLTVTGSIDARDVQFMCDSMTMLTNLDISSSVIDAYTGTEGTEYGITWTYSANEMPMFSFYSTQTLIAKTSLLSVVLPLGLTSIGLSAFRSCSGLTSVTFPVSLTSIGDDAFDGCNRLVSVNFPTDLTAIYSYAFRGCNELTSIVLPASLTSIGPSAFRNCSGLTEITNLNLNPITIDASVFAGVDKTACTLKVPFGSKTLYEAADVWKDFFIEEANVGIEDAINSIDGIDIYPNPVADRLYLDGLTGREDITINDISGHTLYICKSDGATQMQISVGGLASGMYFVRISTTTATKTIKIIKE